MSNDQRPQDPREISAELHTINLSLGVLLRKMDKVRDRYQQLSRTPEELGAGQVTRPRDPARVLGDIGRELDSVTKDLERAHARVTRVVAHDAVDLWRASEADKRLMRQVRGDIEHQTGRDQQQVKTRNTQDAQQIARQLEQQRALEREVRAREARER